MERAGGYRLLTAVMVENGKPFLCACVLLYIRRGATKYVLALLQQSVTTGLSDFDAKKGKMNER